MPPELDRPVGNRNRQHGAARCPRTPPAVSDRQQQQLVNVKLARVLNLTGAAGGQTSGTPRVLLQGLHHPAQLRRSWYFFFFDVPELPETVVHANRWHFFRHFLRDARPAFTPQEMDRYVEAWSQPGAATASEVVYEKWPPRDLFPFKRELPLLSIQSH
jgi:hypothetical protein